MNILFIDDQPEIREQAKKFLEKEEKKFKVFTGRSAEAGMEVLENREIDVIVSDYRMPEKDGLDFLRKLRNRGIEIPFILLTGVGGRGVAEKASAIGGDHFLLKGTDPKNTYKILADYIKNAYTERKEKVETSNEEEEPEKTTIKILFVDDEPALTEQAKIFLEKENHNLKVITANSADKGFKKLDKEDFDAVVSDYKMPEVDGLEFLRVLRDEGNDIPFIIFTGKGGRDVALQAMKLEGNHLVLKGDDPKSRYNTLAEKIVEIVERQKSK